DREFRSVELAYWLKNKKVKFALRQKQDTYICPKGGNYQLLSELGLAPGMKFFYSGVTYTKKPGFSEKAWVPLVANLHSQHMRDFQQIYSQLTRVNQSQLTQNKKDSSFEL
ncbi:MAG TPA: hypothetical protein DEG47_02595, partial [Cyanobacteria bacterium UBA11148]|nr:hypothetical protein [Cyanobacteria bacterium UBA11148]